MYIGSLEIAIKIETAYSLKEKRHIIKSVLERVKSRFNFSAAEVGEQEIRNYSVLGFSCVTNEKKHTTKMLDELERFLENDYRFEILDFRREIL